jgi:hypothetical protein
MQQKANIIINKRNLTWEIFFGGGGIFLAHVARDHNHAAKGFQITK